MKAKILAEKIYDKANCYTQEHVDDYNNRIDGFICGYDTAKLIWKKINWDDPRKEAVLALKSKHNIINKIDEGLEISHMLMGYTHYILISDLLNFDKE